MSKKSRRRRENEKIYRQIIDKLEQSYKSSDSQSFVKTQATLGGWIVNMAAVASSFHGKCSSVCLVPGRTFFVSILALFMVNIMYIQSTYLLSTEQNYQYSEFIKLVMGATSTVWLLQAIFILLIYILEIQPSYTLKKETIRH